MSTEQAPISRDDIESKFRKIKDDVVDPVTDNAKNKYVPAASAAGILLALLFFLLGRRAGSKRSAVVEVRRL